MGKKLYVNKMTKDRSFGQATENKLIKRNLKTLGYSPEKAPPVINAGRYISILFAPNEDNPRTMLLLDFKKNPDAVRSILGDAAGQNLLSKWTAILEVYNSNYDLYSSKFELAFLE